MQGSGAVGHKSFRSTMPPKPNPALEGTRGSSGFSLCERFRRAPLSFAFGVMSTRHTRDKRWIREMVTIRSIVLAISLSISVLALPAWPEQASRAYVVGLLFT